MKEKCSNQHHPHPHPHPPSSEIATMFGRAVGFGRVQGARSNHQMKWKGQCCGLADVWRSLKSLLVLDIPPSMPTPSSWTLPFHPFTPYPLQAIHTNPIYLAVLFVIRPHRTPDWVADTIATATNLRQNTKVLQQAHVLAWESTPA